MKVIIVKEVKRSDGLWRFACGDVSHRKASLSSNFSADISTDCWKHAEQCWKGAQSCICHDFQRLISAVLNEWKLSLSTTSHISKKCIELLLAFLVSKPFSSNHLYNFFSEYKLRHINCISFDHFLSKHPGKAFCPPPELDSAFFVWDFSNKKCIHLWPFFL